MLPAIICLSYFSIAYKIPHLNTAPLHPPDTGTNAPSSALSASPFSTALANATDASNHGDAATSFPGRSSITLASQCARVSGAAARAGSGMWGRRAGSARDGRERFEESWSAWGGGEGRE